ncbi:MAG: hypothetical protein KGJ86_16800, partial [Chloroflexota bacterium]|nr:hypothetical protein [Chloroflexota bacterium]
FTCGPRSWAADVAMLEGSGIEPTGPERQALEELPAPTAWPMLMAFGVVMAVFGIITNGVFFYTGLVVAVLGVAGWMRLLIVEVRETRAEAHTSASDRR